MILKESGPKDDKVLVTFQFPAIVWATSVHLVGDFNRWDPSSLPMTCTANGGSEQWQITLTLDRGKAYQYRYLINGVTWCNDCNADRYVSNPQEGYNSVVQT